MEIGAGGIAGSKPTRLRPGRRDFEGLSVVNGKRTSFGRNLEQRLLRELDRSQTGHGEALRGEPPAERDAAAHGLIQLDRDLEIGSDVPGTLPALPGVIEAIAMIGPASSLMSFSGSRWGMPGKNVSIAFWCMSL